MEVITVVKGDLLDQPDLDLIVNAANTHLEHMGGIAGAISRAGGPGVQMESRLKRPIATGNAVITTAGDLPYAGIVHAVGPIWNGGSFEEEKLLHLAHTNAMLRASTFAGEVLGRRVKVGFPAISCGIFGYPVDLAAPIAVKAAYQFAPHLRIDEVRFVLFSDDHYEAYLAADAFAGAQAEAAR